MVIPAWLGEETTDPRAEPRHWPRHDFRCHARLESRIAREHLVSAVAVEGHRHVAPRELGDQKRGDGGRVTEGPVVQTHEPFDQRHRIRLHDELRVMRRAVRGHLTRIRRLVERRIAGEAKAERLDGLADQSAHQRHHHARIHPAAQKRPERNIRDEPFSHRLGDRT